MSKAAATWCATTPHASACACTPQCIMVEGDPGKEMFFLMKGEVEMLASDRRLGFLAEGAFFGELAGVAWQQL